MSADLDRFDRMALAAGFVQALNVATRSPAPVRLYVPPEQREPMITSKRGPRFVDHTPCPLCGVDKLGIEFHGVLMTGTKIHTLAAHSPGKRSVQNGQPRCLGATMRVEFVGGVWRGVQP